MDTKASGILKRIINLAYSGRQGSRRVSLVRDGGPSENYGTGGKRQGQLPQTKRRKCCIRGEKVAPRYGCIISSYGW